MYWIFLINLLVSTPVFAQSIVCNSSGCVPNNLQATVQEKSAFSSIDLGFNSTPFSILTGTGTSAKPLRMGFQNGAFPGKNVTVDLSANQTEKNAGNLMMFTDNIDTLDIKLNGFNGAAGQSAAQLCATRILANQYGNDTRLRFLQRRAATGSGLQSDKCAQVDVDDIQSNKFSCNDASYSSLDVLDPKINVTRIRKNSRCQAIVPQNVCYQKTYTMSCNYRVFVKSYNDYYEGMVNSLIAITPYTCPDRPDHQPFSKAYSPNTQNASYPQNQNYFRKNGTPHPVSMTINRTYNQEQLQALLNQGGDVRGVCSNFMTTEPELNWIKTGQASIYAFSAGGVRCNNIFGYCGCNDTNHVYSQSGASGDFDWVVTGSVSPAETSPGRDSTLQRLSGGTPFTPSPNGNGALRQTNSAGWQLEIMPAFFQGCNPNFTFITTETSNITKSLYDPNQSTNNSSYCTNPSDPTNCSINPPFCDDPSNSQNCRKVSMCEQINKNYCLDVNDRTNCSSPPFCDDSTSSVNCSTAPVAKSCDPSDPLNSFCERDPNNLAQFQFIGTDPDPFKNTESLDCRVSNCAVQYKSEETNYTLDTLQPTNGQNGTLPGQGLFFVYDIRSLTQQSLAGQAGAGGLNDLVSPTEVRYCAAKRDFTTDPNTQYENEPEVTFRKVFWKSFDVKSGGQPGQYPSFTNKKVEVFKKLDPSTRYLLKKELL